MSTLEEHFVNKGFREGFRDGFQKEFQKGFQKGFQEGFQKGLPEGKLKGLVKVALSMLSSGVPFDFVQKHTGLPLEKIKNLADSLTQAKTSHTVGTSASS